MNILVIGASQGTGALCVRAALDQGHRVSAFARSPKKLVLEHPQLKRIAGDFHQEASVRSAVTGHDAVIITASATRISAFKENPNYFSAGTQLVVQAMKASGVKRLVVLSAFGVGDSRAHANVLVRALVMGWLLKYPFEDHERQEAIVRQSGLDWVIARPGRLTRGAARGRYQTPTTPERMPPALSRADLAHFLVQACLAPTWVGQTVYVG